jgi:hypothetical protein
MREVGKNQHQQQWIAALEAKFDGKGAPYGRASFDAFLHDFDVSNGRYSHLEYQI